MAPELSSSTNIVGFEFELVNADSHTGSGSGTIADAAELIDVNLVLCTRSFTIT